MIGFIADGGEKLSKLLSEKYNIGYSAFSILIRKKDIKVNGVRIKGDVVLGSGDDVKVYYVKDNTVVLRVVYEDSNLYIVDKPAGIESAGAGSAEEVLRERGINVSAAHRLDRNTSGLLILCKNPQALEAVMSASKEGEISKVYIAEVYGAMPHNSGVLTQYLLKDGDEGMVRIFDNPFPGAQKIITGYKVLEKRDNTSIVEVTIKRGKTHQIRASLSHIGNFIVGDGKYGDNAFNRTAGKKRQELRSVRIIFGSMPALLEYLSGKIISAE